MEKNKTNIEIVLIAVFALFIVYGTTIPFNFSGFESALKKVTTIAWRPFYTNTGVRASITDMVQNIMLFIPIGFLWGIFFRRIKWIIPGSIIAVLSGTFLSMAVESLQLFTDDRVVSITDVIFNTVGTAAGFTGSLIVMYGVGGLVVFPAIRSFVANNAFVPFTFVFAIIAAEILQPFDFSLDLGGIYTHLKTLLNDPFQWPSVIRDEPAILLFYMVLTSYALKLSQFSPVKLSGGKMVLLMFVIVCGLESIQFIIMSRMPGGTDILTGVAGVLCGVLFHKMNMNLQGMLLSVLIFIAAFCKYFSPFEIVSQYQSVNWVPFLAEYSKTTMASLGNVLELTVLFIFTGYCTFTFFSTRNARAVLIVIWGVMIVSFEFLQGFIAGRFPDVSDVLVGVVALFTGVLFKVRFEERSQSSHPPNLPLHLK